MNYTRSQIEHLRKKELIDIVLQNFKLWPAGETWDADPMARKGLPTTTTLKKVIIERFLRPRDGDEIEHDEENDTNDTGHDDANKTGHANNTNDANDTNDTGHGMATDDDEMEHEVETTDAKNANDTNATGNANDANETGHANATNDIGHVNDRNDVGHAVAIDDDEMHEVESTVIGETTDTKNANVTNDMGHANDTNDAGHTMAIDDDEMEHEDNIESQEETVIESQEETVIENQEETVITVLTALAESDPEWSAGFKNCHSSKNKRMSDYETLQNYLFVVNFNKKWFLRRVMVKDQEIIVRRSDVLEALDYKAPWYTQALQVVELFEKLNNQDEERKLLKKSHLGGRGLKKKWSGTS